MRKWLIALFAALSVGNADALTLRAKPADGPLATTAKALPSAEAVKTFRASTVAEVGKLAAWDSGEYHIELRDAPSATGDLLEVYIRVTVGGVVRGLEKGNCEWSHQKIYGPPLMVPDGSAHTETLDGQPVQVSNFKEDPSEALRQVLAENMELIIQPGAATPNKTCSTTSTFYPDPDPESTSVDGQLQRFSTNSTWAGIRDATAASTASDTSAGNYVGLLLAGSSSERWTQINRSSFLFDTSAIPDGDTVSAATLSLFGFSTSADGFGSAEIIVCAHTPASNTALGVSDYDITTFGGTAFVRAAGSGWNDAAYNDFALNASGVAAISPTGISKFGTMLGWDFDNSPPAWSSGATAKYLARYADQTGTTNDPKLVVEHASASGSPVILGAPF